MSAEFSLEDGKKFIELARKSIEYFSLTGKMYSAICEEERYKEKRGVFVTLNSFPGKELRGCVGLPYAVKSLWNAIIEAAVSAAFQDNRFAPVKGDELEKIIVEVSVLTEPKAVNKESVLEEIEVGKDGLIVKKGYYSGLLLPKVATEYSWDAKTFLEHACEKAGLIPTAWKQEETEIYKFQAQVFKEKEPKGEVVEE